MIKNNNLCMESAKDIMELHMTCVMIYIYPSCVIKLMMIHVVMNRHNIILTNLSSYAMYSIKGILIYTGLNKHCESSYIMQFKFNYFDAIPST